MRVLGSSLLWLFLTGEAAACPLCHSNTADEVRAGIWNTVRDGEIFLAVLGPFLVLTCIVSYLHQGDTCMKEMRRSCEE